MTGRRFDPLSVLGCDEEEFRAVMRGRPVTPGEVEAAARTHYRWRSHLHEDGSYWVTTAEAARLLGGSPTTVRRLVASGRLPCLVHVSGVRLFARDQVEAITERSRRGRREGGPLPHQAGPGAGS